jgi:localization factor PodJL
MTQGPWSVKGIDPRVREIARERAQRQGVTLGQYLNSLLLEADSSPVRDIDLSDPLPRATDDHDLRRMSVEIDQLAQRLEASTSRARRAISGVDKSILGLMGKVDSSGKAQLMALERVTRALGEIESTQTALRSRIDSLEGEGRSTSTLEGLKTLEASLDRLAGTVQERLAFAEEDQKQFRDLFEEKVSEVSNKVDDVARSVDAAVNNAFARTRTGITGRIDQVEEKMSSAERRIEAGINAHHRRRLPLRTVRNQGRTRRRRHHLAHGARPRIHPSRARAPCRSRSSTASTPWRRRRARP